MPARGAAGPLPIPPGRPIDPIGFGGRLGDALNLTRLARLPVAGFGSKWQLPEINYRPLLPAWAETDPRQAYANFTQHAISAAGLLETNLPFPDNLATASMTQMHDFLKIPAWCNSRWPLDDAWSSRCRAALTRHHHSQ